METASDSLKNSAKINAELLNEFTIKTKTEEII